jgi:hypothetical protein
LPEDERRSTLRNVVICKVLRLFKKETINKAQNKETKSTKTDSLKTDTKSPEHLVAMAS